MEAVPCMIPIKAFTWLVKQGIIKPQIVEDAVRTATTREMVAMGYTTEQRRYLRKKGCVHAMQAGKGGISKHILYDLSKIEKLGISPKGKVLEG